MQQSGEHEFLFYEKEVQTFPSLFLSLKSLDSAELDLVYPGGISYIFVVKSASLFGPTLLVRLGNISQN